MLQLSWHNMAHEVKYNNINFETNLILKRNVKLIETVFKMKYFYILVCFHSLQNKTKHFLHFLWNKIFRC